MGGPYNYVSVILDAHLPSGGDWRRFVEDTLTRRGLRLDGEEVRRGDAFVAYASLHDPSEAEGLFGREPWFSLADRGRFRGKPVGFFNWEHYGSEDPFDRMAVFDFRGTIGRLDSGESREAIVETRFPLDNLVSRYGFEDGDALLGGVGPDYDEEICRRIESALEAAGYPALLGVGIARDVTAHNPVTLAAGLLRRASDGEEIRATEDILRPIQVELLTFNSELLSSGEKAFWRWP